MSFQPDKFLDLTATEHVSLFEGVEYVWEVLPRISTYLKKNLNPGMRGELVGQPFIGKQVFIGEGTVVEPGAVIKGPAWIGKNCQVRTGAYIRDNVIIGDDCIVGNSCEFKNCVLFNGCQVPHFSYVGDSILGARAHLAAGVIISNLKLQGDEVVIRHEGKNLKTGLRKFGAILGDDVEVGCNAVLSPGSILGRRSLVYPGAQWRGVLAEDRIVKTMVAQQTVPRRSA